MNDNIPDDNNVDNAFKEDFDFGETSDSDTLPTQERSGPNKRLLMILSMGAILLIVLLGYKFIGKSQTPPPPVGTPVRGPSTTPAVTSPKEKTPLSQAPTATEPLPSSTAPSLPSSKEDFNDLAQAFSSVDKTTPPVSEAHSDFLGPDNKIKTPDKSAHTDSISTEQLVKFTQTLEKLNQQMEYNLSQIKYLDAYTREITQTVSKLNAAISAMDNRILALTNTASTLSKDVGMVRTEVGHVKQALGDEGLDLETIPAKQQKSQTPAIVEEPEYVVHAVIPGRAWLRSTKGQIITVTEGDKVGNYGKVLVIDATNGVVLTSSGIAFR